MRRRAFIRRFAVGVMASGMLMDALGRNAPQLELVDDPDVVRYYTRKAIENLHVDKSGWGTVVDINRDTNVITIEWA